jgi:hypothetical protein
MKPIDLVKTQERDAQKWAQSFIETKKEKDWSLDYIDEELMIGWFANAMMAMYDSTFSNEVKVLDAKISKLKSLVLGVDSSVSSNVINETNLKLWSEFVKEFPDELDLQHEKRYLSKWRGCDG